ncbi:WcbI family polysaccharide biosynthesis putative acetyltransferase [Brevundimonas goettingensis]|uniref:Polysaccharide biosynthesis enzyme WcbI domain-containing protein n=1 Tax=Brevundimonas goettingensis TaxID=2774190 RepID=A0A975C2C1_9CAUL|nr:WcbI family polysaccharide biosynthesis putative acetyltransferase [Brevundimonas goettingensis]QTC91174.1 hypothetical protein IFJ75_18580 [Brevundimonas goettingensis]
MKIYVHGNCQAPTLGDLLAEACGPSVEVVTRQVFSIDLDAEVEDYRRDVATADVILAQPVGENYRGTEILSTQWIRANARSDAKILTFPVVYHRGQLPQCFAMTAWHNGRLAYHDAHALDYFLRGKEADQFVDDTSTSDFLPAGLVHAELSQTTLELMRREHAAATDLRVSEIIAGRLTTEQPLHTVNHPTRSVMCELADQALDKLERPERARLEGVDMLDGFVMPPYLSTLLALGHTGAGVWLDEVRVDGRIETRRDFFREVFAIYKSLGPEAVATGVAVDLEINAYLDRYRRARAVEVTHDERPLIEALYKVFNNRSPSSDEVFHHLQTLRRHGPEVVIAVFVNSAEFAQTGGVEGFRARTGLEVDAPPVIAAPERPRRPDATPQTPQPRPAGWKRARKTLLSLVNK